MKSSTARAVLCADGRIHLAAMPGSNYVPDRTDVIVADDLAHNTARTFDCGGAPHYLAEQITTVSDWKRIEVGE